MTKRNLNTNKLKKIKELFSKLKVLGVNIYRIEMSCDDLFYIGAKNENPIDFDKEFDDRIKSRMSKHNDKKAK